MTLQELKDFVFDVLGDFVDPKNIDYMRLAGGKTAVVVLRTGDVPKELIRDEWKRHTEGNPNFAQIDLYL